MDGVGEEASGPTPAIRLPTAAGQMKGWCFVENGLQSSICDDSRCPLQVLIIVRLEVIGSPTELWRCIPIRKRKRD